MEAIRFYRTLQRRWQLLARPTMVGILAGVETPYDSPDNMLDPVAAWPVEILGRITQEAHT